MTLPRIRLAPGRDAPLRGRHPWAFAGALAGSNSETEDGAEVEVVAADGTFVARGLYNGRSQVRVRLYAWDPVPLDEEFFRARIAAALDLRNRTLGLGDPEGACRVVFSEGDGLSGLTVDRYGDYLAVQFTSLALARRQEMILDVLEEALRPRGIVLRTEKGIREEEGLELRDGVVRGDVPEEPFPIVDEGLSFLVDLRTGQKTGYYLDQRVNRVRTASYASGRTVADVCTYTGGFALRAAAGGALSVVGVDRSEPALELARANARRNGVDGVATFEKGDAFTWLQEAAAAERRFGMIILDPPRFARTRRGVPEALKAYHRLNALALACMEPDGILVTCSCSGRVGAADFVQALGRAAGEVGRDVQILETLGQAADHPVSATCPETSYLKCLICRVR